MKVTEKFWNRTSLALVLWTAILALNMDVQAMDLSGFRKARGGAMADGDAMDIRGLSLPQVDEEAIGQSELDMNGYITDLKLDDSLYIVGPGDQFQIYIESAALDKQVNAEGNIVLTKIGVIPVAGMSLKAAKQEILTKIQAKKIKSQCYVNLGRPKMMKVFVTGAINIPGIYQVSGNQRLTDVFIMAQGFSHQAQKGMISITNQAGVTNTVDIRKFYKQGELGSNPYLTQGAQIYIPFLDYQKPIVTVRRDSISVPVQLEENEKVDDLLFKLNGYSTPQLFAAIVVKEKNGEEKLLTPAEAREYQPSNGANIEVHPFTREIYIGGAVQKPGFLMFRSNHKILQYISEAGLLVSSRLAEDITVYSADGTEKTLSVATGQLRPGDMVFVKQNAEQKFINYTPIVLSIASLTLAIITVMGR